MLAQIEELKGKLRAYKPTSGAGKPKRRKPRPHKSAKGPFGRGAGRTGGRAGRQPADGDHRRRGRQAGQAA